MMHLEKEKIAVIGLGYVGLPLAVAFAKHFQTVGFEIDEEKVLSYINGIDKTKEIGDENLKKAELKFTTKIEDIRESTVYIVAVPTPITNENQPDLGALKSASKTVAKVLKKGDFVIYESTVYPGATEEICLPLLEAGSGLTQGEDFKIGYSPERINPGDKIHHLENITKIVAGCNAESTEKIAKIYETIIEAGVYRASSIKVAEATKVVENTQRDVNIAFMNEMAIMFDKMNINSRDVVDAMNTKWNALRFYPGLVGGHCIGVDPYYLSFKAARLGIPSDMILTSRRINERTTSFVKDALIKQLNLAGIKVKGARVAILGLTFKENCPDTRNSKIIDLINELKEYEMTFLINDDWVDTEEVKSEYGLDVISFSKIKDVDAAIFAVNHEYFQNLLKSDIDALFSEKNDELVIIDLRGMFDESDYQLPFYRYWSL